MMLHAFVAMPFGVKNGIDFNCIFTEIIQHALTAAEFVVFRADEGIDTGKDFFRQLLLADLVLVDVSIDNPEAWELSVRQALHPRSIALIGCREGIHPVDVVTDRVFHYHLNDGMPDPAFLAADRAALTQLAILHALKLRPEMSGGAPGHCERELALTAPPTPPRQAILFSGHMIDSPKRNEPRFPASKEAAAAKAIATKLDELTASAEDIGLCSGACGGDLLFAEACLARDVPLTLYLALPVPEFIEQSVAFAGNDWIDRFFAVKNDHRVKTRIATEELGPAPVNVNSFTRTNLWMLFTTLAYGPERARFITLWNGDEGDGTGGTKDMAKRMKTYSQPPYVINPDDL